MRTRKLMSILLSFALLLSLSPVAIAADGLTITVSSQEVIAGESVIVPVHVSTNTGFTNFDLKVSYDSSIMTLKTVQKSGTLAADMSLFDGNVNTGIISGAGVTDEYQEENESTSIMEDGILFKLKFEVSSTAKAGDYSVELSVSNGGAFMNEDNAITPTFVPGTITVKASTTDRTVTFLNGTETVKAETVANGGALTTIPAAPTAADGRSFLGWYAVDGSDCLLDSVDETISGTEASTATAIFADTTYQAIWASSAMIAAGYKTTDGKTSITGISQPSGLQTLVGSCNGGTVKLLQDVNLGSTYLTVAEGTTLTLDLNGKTLSGNGYIDADRNGDYGILLNNGTLALISSAETRGKIALADAGQSVFGYAAVENKGLITRMEKIDVAVTTNSIGEYCCGATAFNSSGDYDDTTSVAVQKIDNCSFSATKASAFTQSYGPLGEITNSTFTGGYYDEEVYADFSAVVLTNETLALLKDCTITNNQSGGEALYIGFDSTVKSIEDCTIAGPNGIVIKGYGTSNKSVIKNLSADITANNGYALTVDDSVAEIAITGGKYKGSAGLFNTQSNTTTITYPEGKTLLEGEDGYWTLSEGYNVYFRNWDGTLLQQISCAANGTAVYTGETPIRAADENCVYTFSEWNTQKDGTGTAYTGNEIANVISDLTLYAQYSTVSARVVSLSYGSGSTGSGGTWLQKGNYASLKAAMDALNSNSGSYNNVVITLNEDAVETSKVKVRKTVTIDLNGHTLTINNNDNGIEIPSLAAYSEAVTLTIKDSAGNGRYEHTSVVAGKYAIMNVKSMQNAQTVVIESGTIEEKGDSCSAICAGDPGGYARVDIKGGTIIGAENGLVAKGGSFAISGGTIQGGTNGIYVSTVDGSDRRSSISGGKIIANGAEGYALKVDYANPVTYVDFSGGRFKNTKTQGNLYPAKDNNGTDVVLTFLDGKSLSPAPDSDGFYEVRVVGTYTFVLKADKEHYNAGETVTVTVSAYGPGGINSFGFTPSYDAQKLTFVDVKPADTTGNFTVNQETGKSGYTVNGKNGITLGTASTDATELVTITFTAKENINAATNITLTNLEMTGVGTQGGDKAVVENTLTVNLHDIRVTLTAEHGTINNGNSLTLYAKYGAKDLYSDAARKTEASVNVSANDGYRLNNKQSESLWKCGDEGYTSFEAIKDLTFTESKSFALQTTKVWTVSFNTNGVTGGSLSSTDAITVDDGTKLSTAGLPTETPNIGYAFTGWKIGSEGGTVSIDTYEVNSNITLTPVFTAQRFDFTTTANQSTVDVTSGAEDGKATYGQNITFTVAPNSGYIVESVGYRIGDQATALTTLSPNQNGAYTIEGSKITGKVTVEVVTKAFYAVTFTVDNQKTYTLGDGNNTFYAKEGTAGLYTDQTFTTRANAPVVTATNGYRLADESKNESLWYAGETSYTTASLFGENATATFNSAVTIYAKTIKQCKVAFAAGDHGTLDGNTELDVDAGTKLEAVTKPTVISNPGYAFDKWSVEDNTAINDDLTVTAIYKNGTYNISLPNSEIVSVSDKSGISDANVVTHGTDVSFKLTVNHGYLVSSVNYKIGDGAAVPVNKGSDGTYTISIAGTDITGNVTVTVESQQTVDVTFAADANGSVGFTTKTVVKDSKLGADNVPTVTPNPGYQFDGWYKDGTKISNLADEMITSAVTYTAKFTHATYSLALSDGLTLKNKDGQSTTTATHGTALTFTPTVEGKVVIGITAKIGDKSVTVTKNPNGSYTIEGNAIVGDLTIEAQTADGSWIFIDKESYKALSADTKIAVLTVSKLASGNYLLGNEGMYWSSKYNAYVKIVGVDETVASLTAKLSIKDDAEVLTLAYTGDINGDGQATPADGGMINDELHEVNRSYPVTEKMRLEMDFSGDETVSTLDIMNILRKYVGLD